MTSGLLGFTFDFNGTLSDDEPIMYEVFAELFGELGKPLSEPDYRHELAGLSDEAIIETWMGERDDLPALVARRVAGYRARVADGSTVPPWVRAAVHRAAAHVPLAVVSGASEAEILPVLAAAGLTDAFAAVIASDHVAAGKPDPEGYLQALDSPRRVWAGRPLPVRRIRRHRGRSRVGGGRGVGVHRDRRYAPA